ncbi:hypothetical protein [Cohnella hongkongensis]|uniref:Replication initiation protein n=1 Tax=Cohnella hongkongensis TaxID=178337 RepID=A0ABV9F4I3_9BACL
MLHTVEMFCKIKSDYYSALLRTLRKLSKLYKARCYDKKNLTHCELLKNNGLNLTLKRIELEDGISYSALEIIMNPARLLNENEYFQLTDLHHYEAIEKAFEKVFKPIKIGFERDKKNKHIKFKLHKISSYNFKRVDFAVNIITEHIELYMRLIRRANIPEGFHLFDMPDLVSKRRKPPKDSFYIVHKNKKGNKTVTVTCYNKGAQLKSENLPFDEEKVMYALRFEVQCEYGKTYNLTRNIEFSQKGFLYFLSRDVSENILNFYFKKTIGYGDYYTLPKAKEIIQSKRLKTEKKHALLKTLEQVNEKRRIWKARDMVSNKREFDKRIKELHKLGVNPVTIPVRWNVDYLPCLFELIEM